MLEGGMSSDQVAAGTRLGGLLRQYRQARGLTQEELASASGLTPRTVANIEGGRTRPYRRSARALADALELSQPEREELDLASRLTSEICSAQITQASQGKTVGSCRGSCRPRLRISSAAARSWLPWMNCWTSTARTRLGRW
jgi:transcriptional regulator with XRE-family HTH domain